MRERITNRAHLEGEWWHVPERAFRPDAAALPVTGVLCTRLAGSAALHDPHDVGGEAVVELVHASGERERFAQFMAFHKSDGFEFGYGGSGPAALAANILGLLLAPREAWRLHGAFKDAFVARLPRDGGLIELASVRTWVEVVWAAERADPDRMADEAELRADAATMAAEPDSDEPA